jgi:proteasome lid subunit RPN8/RPN11
MKAKAHKRLQERLANRMLIVNSEIAESIRGYGVRDYPNETCGAMLGVDGAEGREVRALFPLTNRREDSPRNRFSITGDDFRAAEHAAKKQGFELVGWYHSHPDHPARPSEYDREHAWPWYSYVIVSVAAGEPREMTSWQLSDDRSVFQPEEIAWAVPPGTIKK